MPLSRNRKQQPSQRWWLWTTVWSSCVQRSRRRIAATLNCSLTREHTAVEVYILHTIGKQTASDTEWYDRDCANARAGGCRGGTAPPELSNSFGCRSSLQRPGCSGWTGAEGVQLPLNCSHYIRYDFNAGCSAGSAPFLVIRRITPYLFWQTLINTIVHSRRLLAVLAGTKIVKTADPDGWNYAFVDLNDFFQEFR